MITKIDDEWIELRHGQERKTRPALSARSSAAIYDVWNWAINVRH